MARADVRCLIYPFWLIHGFVRKKSCLFFGQMPQRTEKFYFVIARKWMQINLR